jgi:N-acyl-D-amino-acid deacylase
LLLGGLEDPQRLIVINNCYTEEQLHDTFMHPLCVPGGDATALAPDGPLAGTFFHGAYTWAAWYWRTMVRDSKVTLSPSEAVRRLTAAPAARLGLTDRGMLREGMRADIVVFSSERFSERGSKFDPNHLAEGVNHVIVNGVPTLRDGELTGRRAGMVLRR